MNVTFALGKSEGALQPQLGPEKYNTITSTELAIESLFRGCNKNVQGFTAATAAHKDARSAYVRKEIKLTVGCRARILLCVGGNVY